MVGILEYLSDFNFEISHQPGKANVVADALSRKSQGVIANLVGEHSLEKLGSAVSHPDIVDQILTTQRTDEVVAKRKPL